MSTAKGHVVYLIDLRTSASQQFYNASQQTQKIQEPEWNLSRTFQGIRPIITMQLCFCLDPVTISFLIDIHSTTVTPCPTLDPGFNFHYGKGSLEEANCSS